MLLNLSVPESYFSELRAVSDPNSLECMSLLQRLADSAAGAADALLAFATGNSDTRRSVWTWPLDVRFICNSFRLLKV